MSLHCKIWFYSQEPLTQERSYTRTHMNYTLNEWHSHSSLRQHQTELAVWKWDCWSKAEGKEEETLCRIHRTYDTILEERKSKTSASSSKQSTFLSIQECNRLFAPWLDFRKIMSVSSLMWFLLLLHVFALLLLFLLSNVFLSKNTQEGDIQYTMILISDVFLCCFFSLDNLLGNNTETQWILDVISNSKCSRVSCAAHTKMKIL